MGEICQVVSSLFEVSFALQWFSVIQTVCSVADLTVVIALCVECLSFWMVQSDHVFKTGCDWNQIFLLPFSLQQWGAPCGILCLCLCPSSGATSFRGLRRNGRHPLLSSLAPLSTHCSPVTRITSSLALSLARNESWNRLNWEGSRLCNLCCLEIISIFIFVWRWGGWESALTCTTEDQSAQVRAVSRLVLESLRCLQRHRRLRLTGRPERTKL